jgi:uncharacterized protein YqgC (DUF456 family)
VIGAFIGEFIDHQDAIRSGRVSIATTLGMLIGLAIKLGLAFAMLGILIFCWLVFFLRRFKAFFPTNCFGCATVRKTLSITTR